MTNAKFPWGSAAFAVAAGIALVSFAVPPPLVFAVVILWCGSLWLAVAGPPEHDVSQPPAPLDEAQMGDLFEMSEVPVLVTTRDRITVANAAARNLFGAHVVGQDVRVALRHPRAVELIDSADADGATIPGLVRRRDVWRINRKTLPGKVAVFELVNKTAEADISRAHTDFVANASHELRTPLASIIGYVETLRDDPEGMAKDTGSRFLGTIHREAKRLQSLVEDLMSLSRIEAEKHDLPHATVDLSSLVERAARDATGNERLERLDIEASPGIVIQGDAQQLEQMVRNLVDNAFKYGGTEETVTVSLAASRGDKAVLTVTDRGEGIASEHLPHLTRRFYRTDPGRSRASGGTGLGLAIVKHIVERHRGKLDISSKVGVGSQVSVRLPIAAATEEKGAT